VEHLPLLRRAYDYCRDLRTRLPAATVAQSSNRLRQLMTSTLLSPSHIAAPVQADISSPMATPRQPQLSAPPSTAKRQSAHYKTTVPILRTATKPNAAVITHPSSLFETERSGHTPALNPHRPTPLPAQTPPRFPPSRFSDACLRASSRACAWQASENP
jgi:hypothetical protein